MSRVLYFDAFSGMSGDMVLGAFLDAGLPLAELRQALGSLALPHCEISASKVLRAGVSATHFVVHEEAAAVAEPAAIAGEHSHAHAHSHAHVHSHDQGSYAHVTHGQEAHTHPHSDRTDAAPHEHDTHHAHDAHHAHEHRSLPEIERLIDRSALSDAGKGRAKAMFQRLAEAEARIHQMPVERVHLHEVGALDSIIDIVGVVFAMEWAGVDEVVCSPLNVGSGMVRSAHGLFPVPAPATLALLGDAPIYSGSVRHELVTPTGALIATTYAARYGAIPPMSIDRIGYGAGSRDHDQTPNVLRILIGRRTDARAASGESAPEHGTSARSAAVEGTVVPGESAQRTAADVTRSATPGEGTSTTERVSVIECEIDDMNPQLYGVAMDRLFAGGALDVFFVPAQMKKNRPGTLLTIIAPPERRAALSTIVFQETTTIGVRYHDVDRECLAREVVEVATPAGTIRIKVARRDGRIINVVPEFDDCAAAARSTGLSVKAVQALALQALGARAGAHFE